MPPTLVYLCCCWRSRQLPQQLDSNQQKVPLLQHAIASSHDGDWAQCIAGAVAVCNPPPRSNAEDVDVVAELLLHCRTCCRLCGAPCKHNNHLYYAPPMCNGVPHALSYAASLMQGTGTTCSTGGSRQCMAVVGMRRARRPSVHLLPTGFAVPPPPTALGGAARLRVAAPQRALLLSLAAARTDSRPAAAPAARSLLSARCCCPRPLPAGSCAQREPRGLMDQH